MREIRDDIPRTENTGEVRYQTPGRVGGFGGSRINERVGAIPAGQDVGANAAIQRVVADAAAQDIVASATGELVISGSEPGNRVPVIVANNSGVTVVIDIDCQGGAAQRVEQAVFVEAENRAVGELL